MKFFTDLQSYVLEKWLEISPANKKLVRIEGFI